MMSNAGDMDIILACTLCDLYLYICLFINLQIRCFVEAELCDDIGSCINFIDVSTTAHIPDTALRSWWLTGREVATNLMLRLNGNKLTVTYHNTRHCP